MNQFESSIEVLKNKKKENSFFGVLKGCFIESHEILKECFIKYYEIWKNSFETYKRKRKTIDIQIKSLEKIHKSVNNKETEEIFDKFVEESYKNFLYSIEYNYETVKDKNLKEHYEKIIKSDEYQYLINYFKKEETFDIYKRICQKTKYFDFYELMKINSEEPFNDKEQSLFMENLSKFINLINSHLPKNLTEENKIKNFVDRIVDIKIINTNEK